MNETATVTPDTKLWGIYHTDREYARVIGDPLRTTVEAPTKIAAEEAVAKFGFNDPWGYPVATEVVILTQQILKRQWRHRHE